MKNTGIFIKVKDVLYWEVDLLSMIMTFQNLKMKKGRPTGYASYFESVQAQLLKAKILQWEPLPHTAMK